MRWLPRKRLQIPAVSSPSIPGKGWEAQIIHTRTRTQIIVTAESFKAKHRRVGTVGVFCAFYRL